MKLVQVPTKNIEEVWHIVVKDIADALARSNGYALADHIKKWILEEKMQLWILWDQEDKEKYFGTVVTEVIQRPLQRCLNIKIMTGKHREKWQHLIKHIEEFAWQNKCDLLELVARPGWKKVLKPFGYKESHILLEKKRRVNMSSGGGGQTTTQSSAVQPYSAAEPGLNQILSEAGTIYGQGPAGAGYVAPTQQTLQGLGAQETIAGAANKQILDTIQGQYTNPFLSPMIAQAGQDIYSSVAGQFSGAGRTPGSPMMQSTVTGQVADKMAPYAFQQLERERNRQLQTAQQVPSLTAVGGALEDITRQQNMAPQQSLAQYYNTVAPIAYGLPTQQNTTTQPGANPLGMAAGGAMSGAAMGNMFVPGGGGAMMGAAVGGLGGLLGGLL